jgi:hypothetical protein
MSSLIKCRKCGGPHVTLKCGKEKQNLDQFLNDKYPPIINTDYKSSNQFNKVYIDKRKISTVRISNLPDDITVDELTGLVNEWGKIGRININNYENKSAFIDFYNIHEAEYFVKALNRTPFDNLIMNVEILIKND